MARATPDGHLRGQIVDALQRWGTQPVSIAYSAFLLPPVRGPEP